MADWYIRIVGGRKEEVDKHLLVQAVLAMARLLEMRQRAEVELESGAADATSGSVGDQS